MNEIENFIRDNFEIKGISGSNLVIECLWCGDPKHLWFDVQKGVFHCFKCESKGNFYTFVSKFNRLYGTNIRVGDRRNLENIRNRLSKFLKNSQENVAISEKICNNYSEYYELRESLLSLYESPDFCKRYIIKRGYSLSFLDKVGVKYCNKGRYKGRLIFPITTNENFMFQAYDATKRLKPKQLNSIGAKKGYFLYRYNDVKNAEVVIITEGIFDALRCWKHGYQATCIFGKTISNEQLYLLSNLSCREIVVFLDSDTVTDDNIKLKTGLYGAVNLLQKYIPKKISYIYAPEYKDPDEIKDKKIFDKYYNNRNYDIVNLVIKYKFNNKGGRRDEY